MTQKNEIEEDQISGSTYYIHGLEELRRLKCPYYPKQYIDSTQFLSRFQWRIYRTRTNISKIYMEPQKAPHSNSDPEKEDWSWKNHST